VLPTVFNFYFFIGKQANSVCVVVASE